MIINHNITALNAHRQLGINTGNIGKNVEKLSSGLRINRAADDAAGLSISEKMRAQIRGMQQAARNAQDGISLIQTAEGALQTVNDILVRIKELATQSATGTYNNTDRKRIQEELTELASEIENIANNTKFNEIDLLNGKGASGSTSLSLQIGIGDTQVLELDLQKFNITDPAGSVSGLSVVSSVKGWNLDNQTDATSVLQEIDGIIDLVSAARSYLGANQNRLEKTINNLNINVENLTSAESRIRDTDMAKEMMEFTKNNILTQASQAMLAQANMTPQGVLQLLR